MELEFRKTGRAQNYGDRTEVTTQLLLSYRKEKVEEKCVLPHVREDEAHVSVEATASAAAVDRSL